MIGDLINLTINRVDFRDLFYMAFFARLAYEPNLRNDPVAYRALGWNSTFTQRAAGLHAPQFYVVQTKDWQIVAIAGTTEFSQWMTYVTQAGMSNDGIIGGSTFGPFTLWASIILNRVVARLDIALPVFVTGHSLGGALGIMLGDYLRRRGFHVRRVVTFGCPKVGDENFCLGISVPVINIRRPEDPVPQLPPRVSLTPWDRPGLGDQVPPLTRPGGDIPLSSGHTPLFPPASILPPIPDFLWPATLLGNAMSGHLVDGYVRLVWDRLLPPARDQYGILRNVANAAWNAGLS